MDDMDVVKRVKSVCCQNEVDLFDVRARFLVTSTISYLFNSILKY